MKTMELTQMTVAQYNATSMTTKVNNFKKATKKFFKATYRFIKEASEVYPQYLERQERDIINNWYFGVARK